jgi:DNA-binding MarR family transcriptional regulator
MTQNATPPFIASLPGHLVRRLQQIAVAAFYEQTADWDVTPIQFAALQTVSENPLIDQRTLAGAIALDASTTGGVVDRLEKRGLVRRSPAKEDRRVKQLRATARGMRLLATLRPYVQRAQERIIAPLTPRQAREFIHLMEILVRENNLLSRAPLESDKTP